MRLSFVIPGKPLPQKRPIVRRAGWTIDPPESVKEKRRIATIALMEMAKQRWAMTDQPVKVSLTFHGANKLCDIDNLVKLCLDAVKGVVWKDDRQVQQLFAIKRDSTKVSARTCFRISEQ